MINNIFEEVPTASEQEIFDTLFETGDIKVERIVSYGQSSPAEGWYDQDRDEWVSVLSGAAVIAFEDGRRVELEKGGFLHIPKHCKHRVAWTDPGQPTIWLTIFHGGR